LDRVLDNVFLLKAQNNEKGWLKNGVFIYRQRNICWWSTV